MDIISRWILSGLKTEKRVNCLLYKPDQKRLSPGQDKNVLKEYKLEKTSKILVSGIAVGSKIGSGKVRILSSAKNISSF